MQPYRRIATEEAWLPAELLHRYARMIESDPHAEPGFRSMWGFWGSRERAGPLAERIQDLDARRLTDMDAARIDQQLVFLAPPGVQVFDAATGCALAVSCNDQLAEAVRRHPRRFAGLAAIAPQNAAGAAQELERAVRELGLRGAVINSHTQGRYLDDVRYWDIFAAAESLGVPIYLHPSYLPSSMVEPFLARGLESGMWGFAAETGLHALRIILSGVFDRFPRLQMVLGHLGEALPFWLYRIDYLHGVMSRSGRYAGVKPLARKPSEYLLENFHYTTSGVPWAPAVMFLHSLVGPERLMYAMDYPFQYVPEEVTFMDALPLGGVHKALFFQGNAERLFNLEA